MLSSLLIIPLVFWAAAEGTDLSAKKSECYGVALILPGGSRICPNLLRFDEKLDCCAHTEESRKEVAAHNKTMTAMAADSALDRFLLRLRRKRCALCGAGHSDDAVTTPQPQNSESTQFTTKKGNEEIKLLVTSTTSPSIGSQKFTAAMDPKPTCITGKPVRNTIGHPKCPEFAPYYATMDCCAVPVGKTATGEFHISAEKPSPRCLRGHSPGNLDGQRVCPDYAPFEKQIDCCAIPLPTGQSELSGDAALLSAKCIDALPQNICPYFTMHDPALKCCAISVESLFPISPIEFPRKFCVSPRTPTDENGFGCPPFTVYSSKNDCCTVKSQWVPTANQTEVLPTSRCTAHKAPRNDSGEPDCPEYAEYEPKFDCCAYPALPNAIELIPFPPLRESEFAAMQKSRCILWPINAGSSSNHECPPNSNYAEQLKCCAVPIVSKSATANSTTF